jgi:putative ABC transport system ATP-binding protein
METALETRNIQKTYASGSLSVTAVDNVSIRINPGEFVALVGPSGSGKTSLLAMLAGLLTPTSGQVIIDGQEMSAFSDRERTRFRREKIGITFQSNNLVPYLTALENVELMLRLNGAHKTGGRARAAALLERLGLGDRLDNLPGQLSGGQQQRVAIARALIHNPRVVLADEPTASLDTGRAHQVVATFADLIHEQGRAGIMVTHDLRVVKYVDKVIKMVDGKLAGVISESRAIQAMAAAGDFGEAKPVRTNRRSVAPLFAPVWAGAGD